MNPPMGPPMSPSSGPVWLKEYPPGVPAEIDPNAYASAAEVFEKSCAQFRERVAFECMGARLSYGQIEELSGQFASFLQNDLGLRHGDRVAIMMPNLLQYPVTMFGVLRAGLTVVNINPLYTPRELEHQLQDSGARVIVISENFCFTLQKTLDKVKLDAVIATGIGDLHPFPKSLLVNFVVRKIRKMVPPWKIPGAIPLREALARGRRKPRQPVRVEGEDTAFLQYTGGTTGLSKGAQLLHRNVVANMLQMKAWIGTGLAAGEGEQDVIITALPLYHIYALTVNCLTLFPFGAKNVLIPNPRDLRGFVKELGKHRFTVMTGVNTLFNGLLHTPGFDQLDFSAVKIWAGGGAAVLRATADRWKAVTGKGIAEGYGLTEASPVVTSQPIDKLDWNGTIGVPVPSTRVSLRDDDNREVPLGLPGELCVKGPQVMAGYWNRPEETAKVFTPDGYLRTGDIATRDERGYFRIVDRKKDMILVSGFNVFPNEIEGVVSLHPGVVECACIGVTDDKTGEAVKVFVVKKDPNLTIEQLRGYCREHLAAYKIPKFIEFRNKLPKSNIGKILRKELRGGEA